MRKNLFFTAILAVSVIMLATSCSSPTSKGNKFGEKFYENLIGYDSYTHVSQFRAKKDSADSVVKPLIEEYVQGCEGDTAKINLFYSTYNKWVDSAMINFSAAFENCMHNELEGQVWYRENDPQSFYLYAFEDSLNILNCKDKIAYTVHYDTLFFADDQSTIAIIDLPNDTTLTLKNVNDDITCNFRKAEPADLVRGIWHYRVEQNILGQWRTSWINFKETGRYSGEEWQSRYTSIAGSYTIKTVNDSTCSLSFGKSSAKNVIFNGIDKFTFESEVYKRNKKTSPKGLDYLFTDKTNADKK